MRPGLVRSALLQVLLAVAALAAPALAAPLIVNEFNAVSSSGYLNGGGASCDGDGECDGTIIQGGNRNGCCS